MSLESRLAMELVCTHPERAAGVFDRVPAARSVRLAAEVTPRPLAALLARMSPHAAAELLELLPEERAARAVEALTLDVAARLARHLGEPRRKTILERLPPKVAGTLETLLRFPPRTAGGLMDPGVLAVPEDLTVRQALARVREASQYAQYNLYVVDRNQSLAGVLNLRELFRARPQLRLSEVMVRKPAHLEANADLSTVLGHPAWRDVRALPVVDERGAYLGAVRYRVVRQLQEELFGSPRFEAETSESLGEVFAAGVSGLLDALAGPGVGRKGGE